MILHSTILLPTLTCVASYSLHNAVRAIVQLPVVDLDYSVHQASFNSTGNYYNFSNIRYAEPPLGSLRFAAPVAPKGRNRTVDNGSVPRICPQAYPAGVFVNQIYNAHYSLTGKTSLKDFENATQGFDYPRNTPQDSRATEDCLFLDVMVPRKTFEKYSRKKSKPGTGVAVMVWIYGGGYAAGTKYDTPAAGLISRSQVSDGEGIIYVAFNYRLGALGWSSGPSFAVDGTPNAGLYDQRLALKWVRDNIHLFGGDPDRVTVFGQSAGGGSIALHLTAFGGQNGKAPFQRAILQSPGYTPMTGKDEQEATFQKFLSLLNVTTLEEARKLPSSAVRAANEAQIRDSRRGSWTYGPAVDGIIVPDLPSLLFLQGRFDQSVKIMVGHNGDEGLGYPSIKDSADFEAYVESTFPNAPDSVLEYITKNVYPTEISTGGSKLEDYDPNSSKSLIVTDYNNTHGRQTLLTSETVINCLTYFVNKAFKGDAYSYFFTVPPALHGQELYYVFYNGQATDVYFRPINVTLAYIVQDYWLSFARTGNPNGKGLPYFSKWGTNSSVHNLNLAGVGPTRDPADNDRCRWWQLGLYT